MEWARMAIGSVAIITDEAGRVLLVRRAYAPFDWVLPGGNAEPMESPTRTVVREVAEETGLHVRPQRLMGVYFQSDHAAGEFLHFVFRCSVAAGMQITTDGGEIAEHGFYSPDQLPEPMSPSTKRRLLDGLAREPQRLPVTLPPPSES